MSAELKGRRIAILLTDGFEQVEMTEPRHALDAAGAETHLVSSKTDVRGFHHDQAGDEFSVDVPLSKAKAADYDGLLLPGGVMNPDSLRIDEKAIAFIQGFVDAGKPIAAICHGPWPLIETGVTRGRRMTSWPSLRTDLINSGADWVDEAVVCDRGLVTSRNPDDIPVFNKKMIEEFVEGEHGPGLSRPARAGYETMTP